LGAVQAQDFAGAKWAVGMRLPGVSDVEVEHAFNRGAILRTHVLRPTWHFVTPRDIRPWLAVSGARVHSVNGTMYRRLGLGYRDFQRAHRAMTAALEGGRSLTRNELAGVLERAGIAVPSGQHLAYLMSQAELDGVICSGPRRGRQFTYALLDERAPSTGPVDRSEALAELTRRYFVTRGPATVQDFAKWSGLKVEEARQGLDAVRDTLQSAEIDGETTWSPPEAGPAKTRSRSALLISVYDEYISSYKDRRAIADGDHASRLFTMGNALTAVILIGGRIVGTWRRVLRRESVLIGIHPFGRMTETEARTVTAAAARYGRFLGLPVVAE
jgi:hypothetical protein